MRRACVSVLLLLLGCGDAPNGGRPSGPSPNVSLELYPALPFEHDGYLPKEYTGVGAKVTMYVATDAVVTLADFASADLKGSVRASHRALKLTLTDKARKRLAEDWEANNRFMYAILVDDDFCAGHHIRGEWDGTLSLVVTEGRAQAIKSAIGGD